MTWSRRWLATVTVLGAAWLQPGALALAQEQSPPKTDSSEGREALEQVVGVREKGNDAAEESQKRIETLADQTDELLAKYRTAWKQIESIDIYNGQMHELISAQEDELASLAGQLERVQSVGRSVTPLMLRMIDALDQFVGLDVPFLIDERKQRVQELHELMVRSDVTTSEKFRQIMEAYQVENEYGRTIEAYRASLDLEGRETTVDFLRFGRIALVYQSIDEKNAGMWSQEKKAWIPLDSGYRSSIREGLRIARKQSAPDLIRLPLPAPMDVRGSS